MSACLLCATAEAAFLISLSSPLLARLRMSPLMIVLLLLAG
jgi:hypothetical protein